MCYIIYKTINQVNGKIYVGKHCQETSAFDGYLGSGKVLKQSFQKYGKENFIRETLEYCTSVNVDEREIFWIDNLSATNSNIGYNISIGGEGGCVGICRSNDTKHKISQSLMGKYCGIKNPNYGNGDKIRGEKNWNFGKVMSLQQRHKISQTEKGKIISFETRKKLSMIGKNRYHTDKTKQKIRDMLTGKSLKYRYILSNNLDFWKDLTKMERKAIYVKFCRQQVDCITYKNVLIERINLK